MSVLTLGGRSQFCGNKAYVTNSGSDSVSGVTATNAVSATVPVGSSHMGLQSNSAGTRYM